MALALNIAAVAFSGLAAVLAIYIRRREERNRTSGGLFSVGDFRERQKHDDLPAWDR